MPVSSARREPSEIPGGSAFGSRSRSSDPAFKMPQRAGDRQFGIHVDALQLDCPSRFTGPERNTGM